MKTWLAAILLLLLAVPFHSFWQSYEQARRGLLLMLVPILCLLPRMFPKDMPRAVLPFLWLTAWLLLRSIGVQNPGLAWERTLMWLSLAVLMIVGSDMTPRDLVRATLPVGLLVAGFALAESLSGLYQQRMLGNINVASEVLTMAGAMAAMLPLCGEKNRGFVFAALATLFLCGAGVVTNTSLSGLIALPLATLPVLLATKVPGRTRFAVVAVLAAGMLLGTGLPEPKPTKPATTVESVATTPSTTDVRVHLWNGTACMGADRFLLGHGSGQFRVHYPRYRQPEEIEATSFGRSFSTGVESAHQDYLELFAEGGLLAFLLLAVGILQVLRQAPLWTWGPLLGFGFLAGVRAPLGNAPAAALLFLWMGTLLHDVHQRQERVSLQFPWRRWLLALLAAATLLAGCSVFLGQWAITGYTRQAWLRGQQQPTSHAEAMASLDNALFWNPYEQKLLQLRARHSLQELERAPQVGKEQREKLLQAARLDTSALLALYPWDEEGLMVRGRLRQLEGKPEEALAALSKLLEIDRQNPRATLAKVTVLVETGDAAEALQALYEDPHPTLRARFLEIFSDLHAIAQRLNLVEDAELLFRERAFLDAVDALTKTPGLSAQLAVNSYIAACRKEAQGSGDMRPVLVQALFLLDLGRRKDAADLAKKAKGRTLRKEHRRLMGKVLDRLMELDPWRRLLWEPGD